MVPDSGDVQKGLTIQTLRKELSPYAHADPGKSILQLVDTFIPYLVLWAVLIHLVNRGYPAYLIVALMIPASLLLVRIFILFHDCTHASFFRSHRANTILGYICGILTFTPFHYWQHNHLVHHGSYADLNRRGVGDIWTLTVEEYRSASGRRQLGYRLYRNPLVFLGVGPGYFFLFTQRLLHQWKGKDERFSILFTNLAIVVVLLAASLTMGLKTYLIIQVPIMLLSGAIGVWLFYVQHQFEGVYWSRHENWDPVKAALNGSSYYKLPKVLQWFTGNIGLHHVHHVLPRIPNYQLQECHDHTPVLQTVRPLGIARSLKSLWLNLWDEKEQKLVSFRSLKKVNTR
ncbi:MAG: fatty acid desaturase [Deltaproteobacteria bacterium]